MSDGDLFEEKSVEAERRDVASAKAWRAAMFDAGFGWITGPTQLGGRGLPGTYQRMYDDEASRFASPQPTTPPPPLCTFADRAAPVHP